MSPASGRQTFAVCRLAREASALSRASGRQTLAVPRLSREEPPLSRVSDRLTFLLPRTSPRILFLSVRSNNQEVHVDEDTREIVLLESSVPAREPEQLAALVIKVMDKIAERMELETPHPSSAKKVRGARMVTREFIVDMIAAVETMPEFQALGTFDAAEARAVLEAMDAHRPVAERMTRLLASINYTIESRWSKVVSAALLTHSLASIQAKDPQNAKLAARVKSLSKILGRKGRKTNKKKEEP